MLVLCVSDEKESTTMKRRSTWKERRLLAEERATRHRELLDQAANLRQQIAARAQQCALLATDTARTPPTKRVAVQIDRLSAAQFALDLAARLLQVDDPDRQPISDGLTQPSARELHSALGERLGRWYRAGSGWWEARTVWRPRIEITHTPDTHEIEIKLAWWPYGPYFYRHWRQEGQQQTEYFGINMPDEFPQDADLVLPEPRPIGEIGPLAVQARALVKHLQIALEQATGKQRQQRLRRAIRRASQRTLRRLRAENRQPPVSNTDEQAQESVSNADEEA